MWDDYTLLMLSANSCCSSLTCGKMDMPKCFLSLFFLSHCYLLSTLVNVIDIDSFAVIFMAFLEMAFS